MVFYKTLPVFTIQQVCSLKLNDVIVKTCHLCCVVFVSLFLSVYKSMDYSYLELFVPWTVRTLLDCSYHGLFVPSLDFSYHGLFVPWTVRTLLDCSYHGLFAPSLDDSYRDARLTKINVSYQNVPVFSVSQTPINFFDISPKR